MVSQLKRRGADSLEIPYANRLERKKIKTKI